jgi:serine/threonine-protein kinase
VARGLVAIHEAGVIHRDLKPSNILLPVTGAPAAVIVDFGHSLVVDDERLTDQGWTLGSASYMAPEQAAGEELDARTDLYALGVVLYRALTGHFPFVHGSPAEVMSQHLREPAIPPRDRAPERDISRESEELCLWMLAKDRSARLPNAHVLHLTLKAMTHAGRR